LKKILIVLLTVAILLLLAVPNTFSSSSPVVVEFPSPIGTHLQTLPIRVIIPDPNCFGYPKVPVEISVTLAEYRQHKVVIPLLEEVDLIAPSSLKRFLDNPIEKIIDFPLPTHKVGSYHLVVDVKCLYGPNYRWSYWYSYTANQELRIVPERVHIVGGPEIKNGKAKFYGYTLSQSTLYDFQRKGISYRFRIRVVDSLGKVLYEEANAIIGTAFNESDLTECYIRTEKESLMKRYNFLLTQFPGALQIIIIFEKTGKGDWRWLFSTQPLDWVAKHGILIEAALPQLEDGSPFFPGLQGIEWLGLVWNPLDEFQLEYISD